MQELQTAVLAGTPVCAIVLDNSGWISIKGGQETFFGRSAWTDFLTPDGSLYSPRLRRHRARLRAPCRAGRRPGRGRAGGPSRAGVRRSIAGPRHRRSRPGDGRPRQDRLVGRPEPGAPSRAARAMGGRRGRGAASMTALARDVGAPARPPLPPCGDRATPCRARRSGPCRSCGTTSTSPTCGTAPTRRRSSTRSPGPGTRAPSSASASRRARRCARRSPSATCDSPRSTCRSRRRSTDRPPTRSPSAASGSACSTTAAARSWCIALDCRPVARNAPAGRASPARRC